MPAFARRRRALIFSLALAGCGPAAKSKIQTGEAKPPPGVEMLAASGRPRLVVVRREGDPSAAIAVELRANDPLRLAIVSAMIGARLESAGFSGVEVIPGMRIARVRGLAPQVSGQTAAQLEALLTKPFAQQEPAMGAVRRAVDDFAARPIDDPALARATRCLDKPVRASSFAAPNPGDLPALAESMRAAQMKSDLVAVAAVAGAGGDAFAQAWRTLPVWQGSTPTKSEEPALSSVTLSMHGGGVVVVEGGPRASLPAVLASLTAADGPLPLRLRASDEWRVRGIAGAARPEGACVVVEVEPARVAKEWNADRFAARAAVALEVARQEIELAFEATRATDEEAARLAISGGGDPRDAADRAAFWAWPAEPRTAMASTASLEVPAPQIAKSPQSDANVESIGPKFVAALGRAKLAWTRPEIDLRTRLEAGQGELWAVLASPCSAAHEGALDAGLANVAVHALVSGQTGLEPWSAASGIGVVAHAAPRAKETGKELAHRLGDALGKVFLSSFPSSTAAQTARNEILVALATPADTVRTSLRSLLPLHPSWLDQAGTLEAVAKVGVEAIDLRLATLRTGPLRLAVIANDSESQADVAAHAAERWLPRTPGEARACPVIDAGAPPKGAVHPITVKSGTGVALAMPVEESSREAAVLLAAVLDGPSGRLAGELGSGLASSWEARLVRGVGRHALVIVAMAPDSNIDGVVARIRALLDKLKTGLDAADLARGEKERDHARMVRRLDPRARVIDLFSGDLATPVAVDLGQLRAVAAKVLDEDKTQLVVARLK
ncbi:MAG: hypothetical protein ACXVEF_09955 [Polyangiales bacterium]